MGKGVLQSNGKVNATKIYLLSTSEIKECTWLMGLISNKLNGCPTVNKELFHKHQEYVTKYFIILLFIYLFIELLFVSYKNPCSCNNNLSKILIMPNCNINYEMHRFSKQNKNWIHVQGCSFQSVTLHVSIQRASCSFIYVSWKEEPHIL